MKLTNNLSDHNKIYLIFALIWTIIVTVLCLISSDELPLPKFEKNYDKLGHMAFHFGITTLWYLYFKHKIFNTKKAIIQAFLISFIYGILIEIAQALFTTTRTADILDVAANTIGALMVVGIVILYQKKTNIIVSK